MKTKSIFFVLFAVFTMSFMAFNFLCPPTVPVLKSPPDGSGVSVPVTLEWYPSECPEEDNKLTYHLQVDTDPNFENAQVDEGSIKETSYRVSDLQNSTTYFWRVRAKCKEGGGFSGWSEVWHFRTENK